MKVFLFLVVFFFLQGCVKLTDLEGPVYTRKPVIIGVIHPDSLLTIQLIWSRPPMDTSKASPILNAQVLFYEDGQELGLAQYLGQGKYQLTKKPSGNRTYKVAVNILDLPLISAEDYMPAWPNSSLIITKRNEANPNQNPDLIFKASEALTNRTALWMGLYSTSYFSKGYSKDCIDQGQIKPGCEPLIIKNINKNAITTRSPVFDSFNGYFDALKNVFSNSSPAKVRTEEFNSDVNRTITFAPFNQGEPWTTERVETDIKPTGENILEITFVGPAYDKYLKSALIAYKNRLTDFDGDLFSPFAEPTPVNSNVKNALGVFGARNGRYIVLKLNTTYTLAP